MAATADTNLSNTTVSKNFSSSQEVPNTAGNYLVYTIESDQKFQIKNTGMSSAGALVATRIKVAYGVATEPDITIFSAEQNTEWLSTGDVVYPPRRCNQVAIKAEAALTKPMVHVKVIERLVAGNEG